MPTLRLAAYTRVSTDAQADAGMGLPIQAETIQRWARAKKHIIQAWCEDAGQSGSNGLDQRAGLAEALDLLRVQRVQGIVVARLDRLARDLVLQEQLLAEITRLGGRLYSCVDAEQDLLRDDDADPSRKLIRQVLGAVAEYERAMIRLRMSAGLARKRAAGGYTGGGAPYGWRIEGGEIVPEPVEQDQIRLMLAARAQGASYREICEMLTRLEVPTRKGGPWQPMVVRRILRHPRTQALAAEYQVA